MPPTTNHLMGFHRLVDRDEEPEKLSKADDGSAVAAGQQVMPTMPHVPITTPPPPVMGSDASSQGNYGAYSSWYQVHKGRLFSKYLAFKN